MDQKRPHVSKAKVFRLLSEAKGKQETEDENSPFKDINFIWKDRRPSLLPDGYEDETILETLLDTLMKAVEGEESGCFDRLDDALAKQVIFKVGKHAYQVFKDTRNVLRRLPPVPPRVKFCVDDRETEEEIHQSVPLGYPEPDASEKNIAERNQLPWEALSVVNQVDTSTIKVTLATKATNSQRTLEQIRSWLDILSQLLDRACESFRQHQAYQRLGVWRLYILCSFIWTVWQRSVHVLFHKVLEHHLLAGYEKSWNSILALRRPFLLAHDDVRNELEGWSFLKSNYMCSWTLRLLMSTQACVGHDLRLLHQRFNECFASIKWDTNNRDENYHIMRIGQHVPVKRAPRCAEDETVCSGKSLEECGRFTNSKLYPGDQSAHDGSCSGSCRKIEWDENQFREHTGGRAVRLERKPEKLTYCKTDEQTLAVSHVWSHGQGGRPEEGLNECLHERFRELAIKNQCKSYWIDTACIPQDHNLRREAIEHINNVFDTSKITLVCDQDIMSLRAPKDENDVQQLERILATMLVSDWNVRAWTLLEAYRGRYSVHLLCKDNEIIPVRDSIETVWRRGRLDLGILMLAAQHLLAAKSDGSRKRGEGTLGTVESGATLLSHRYASREGDNLVIWSLLSRNPVFDHCEDLWSSKIGSRINTGYLMSTAPRLKTTKYFSWAPSSPRVQPLTESRGVKEHYAHDGEGSYQGEITETGLKAVWMYHEVTTEELQETRDKDHPRHQNSCFRAALELCDDDTRVRILFPKMASGPHRYEGGDDRVGSTNVLAAVVYSRDFDDDVKESEWFWHGVFEWNTLAASLPHMTGLEVLLV